MNKILLKAVMQQKHFRKTYLKIPANENRYIQKTSFKKREKLVREGKKQCFANLNEKDVTENFGIVVKKFFLKKLNQGKVPCQLKRVK